MRRGKSRFQGVEKFGPGAKHVIALHPLEPTECGTIHVERKEFELFDFRNLIVFEKAGYCIRPINPWKIEADMGHDFR